MAKDSSFFNKETIKLAGKVYDFKTPMVMGILNVTPDSFFEGSRANGEIEILNKARKLISEGATIVDVGAYSSRPGAEHISSEEELKRLSFALNLIRKEFPDVIISVDTFRSEVAESVIRDFDVAMINDITAGEYDSQMFDVIANKNVAYCMMHMKGMPQNMQKFTDYTNLVNEIVQYFAPKVDALKRKGVSDIIIDPGFGFSKTVDQNYELLANLDTFSIFDEPILVGVSRKSMIFKSLDITASESLNGTTAINTLALNKGAKILRVHDVKEAVEVVTLYKKMQNQINN